MALKIILDKSQLNCKGRKLKELIEENVDLFICKSSGIHHNKVIIIDESTVISGSYNFTKAAEEKNEENLILIKSKEVNKIFTDKFLALYKKSMKLQI